VEQLKAKTTAQLAEIGKKSEAIGRLKLELGEKTAQLFALEARDKDGNDRLTTTSQELETKTAALQQTQQALAEVRRRLEQDLTPRRSGLEKTSADHSGAAVTVDSQRVELVALRAQVEVLKGQIESYDKETRELQQKLSAESASLASAHAELAQE